MASWMDDCADGWHCGGMDGQELGALWMTMDYATQESPQEFGVTWPRPTGGKKVDLHGICGSFGASPHLVRHPSPSTNNAPTPLCFTPTTSTIQLPWMLIGSRLSKGGFRCGDMATAVAVPHTVLVASVTQSSTSSFGGSRIRRPRFQVSAARTNSGPRGIRW